MEFNVHQAKTQFSKLLDLAQEGEEVLIVRNGKPVAELIPARRKGALTLGAGHGTLLNKGMTGGNPWRHRRQRRLLLGDDQQEGTGDGPDRGAGKLAAAIRHPPGNSHASDPIRARRATGDHGMAPPRPI